MQADSPDDTIIDFTLPTPQPQEALAKQRKGFIVLRWVFRVLGGCVILLLATMVAVLLINGEINRYWYAVPLVPISALLLLAWERVQFCPDCDAQIGASILRSKPAWCANCGRLLEPSQILVDPPGVFDLTDERNCREEQPVIKFISFVILLAIKDRATELRFEPGRESYQLIYRCDGRLWNLVPPPWQLHVAISDSLKAIAGLSLAHEPVPKAGPLSINVVDLPIPTLPEYFRRLTAELIATARIRTFSAWIETEPSEFGDQVIVWLPDFNEPANPETHSLAPTPAEA